MATVEFNLLCAIEEHSVDDIRWILDDGFDVRSVVKGKLENVPNRYLHPKRDA